MMEATTGPLITHQRAVFSFVSQHLVEGKDGSKKVALLLEYRKEFRLYYFLLRFL